MLHGVTLGEVEEIWYGSDQFRIQGWIVKPPEFANAINHDYPGADMPDLMRGVDEMLSRGYIDQDNLFVYGCSGGGILTTYIVGNTDRFTAASANCPIVNWMSATPTGSAGP